MSYEYLLRRIYQVGRYGRREVDADVYRELERAERMYVLENDNIESKKPRMSAQSLDQLDYEYRVQCRKIWNIVVESIKVGISKNRHVLSHEEIEEMEKLIIEPRLLAKKHIDKAIEIAENIYINHKIYPA